MRKRKIRRSRKMDYARDGIRYMDEEKAVTVYNQLKDFLVIENYDADIDEDFSFSAFPGRGLREPVKSLSPYCPPPEVFKQYIRWTVDLLSYPREQFLSFADFLYAFQIRIV